MIRIHGLVVVGLLTQGLDSSGSHTVRLADYVRVSLSSERAEYYRGEVLPLRLNARNTSGVAVTSYFEGLDPLRFKATTVFVRRPQQPGFKELALHAKLPGERVVSMGKGPEPRTLYPGKQYEAAFAVSVVVENGARRFILDETGHYEFKVRYEPYGDPNGRLESNILAVEVVEPPASEREAKSAYTPDLAYVALATPGVATPEQMRAAAEFVRRFPSSRYTPSLRERLLSSLEYRTERKVASAEERQLYQELMAGEDRTPLPEIEIAPSLAALWPADRRMVTITITGGVVGAPGSTDPAIPIRLESITCDESCDLDKDVARADFGSDDREFELRADRGQSGVGRTYTITYSAANAGGKRATSSARVKVLPYDTPAEWSPNRVLYLRGEPVMYAGRLWRSARTHRSQPMLVPYPVSEANPSWVKERQGTEWDYPLWYTPGDEVTHLGVKYRCLQRHVSTSILAPSASEIPGLWERVP